MGLAVLMRLAANIGNLIEVAYMYQIRGRAEAYSANLAHIVLGCFVLSELVGTLKRASARGAVIMLRLSVFA